MWREVVCAALGECAYDQIIEYVADGEELEAADVCLFLAPVVEWISNTIIESRGQKAQEAVAKYLDGIGADAI